MCTWRWNTCCPAAEPWFQPTLNAAGWSALPSLVITALTAWNSRAIDSSSRSVSVAAWTLGTTNVCPRAAGMTSRKASAPTLASRQAHEEVGQGGWRTNDAGGRAVVAERDSRRSFARDGSRRQIDAL